MHKNHFILVICIGVISFLLNSSVTIKSDPWLRLSSSLYNIKVSPTGDFIAFTSKDGDNLRVLEVGSKNVYQVSPNMVSQSFFWSPDKCRLFYSELVKEVDNKNKKGNDNVKPSNGVVTNLKGYDCAKKKSSLIDQYDNVTGFLTFSPKNYSMMLLSSGKIHQKKILIEGKKSPDRKGIRWVVSSKGVFLLSQDGSTLKRVMDDESGVESFDISNDGYSVIWSTGAENIYVALNSSKAKRIATGKDPKWNKNGKTFVYVAKREGTQDKYDIKISDLEGNSKYLTSTISLKERYPNWYKEDKIIYTMEDSTDLFLISFKAEDDSGVNIDNIGNINNIDNVDTKNLNKDSKEEINTNKDSNKQINK